MQKKLRVMVTDYCGKACDGCCNKTIKPAGELSFEDVVDPKYGEVLFTGGDPAMFPLPLIALVSEVKKARGRGDYKLYSYMSSYPKQIDLMTHLDKAGLNGVQYTLHAEATDNDVMQLRAATNDLPEFCINLHSNRLAIDSRLYERYDFSNIWLQKWSVIRKMVWLPECPLPEGEELFTFNMMQWYDRLTSKS